MKQNLNIAPEEVPDWTLVVPAYNEEERLGESLPKIRAFIESRGDERWEVIVVDDGSTDCTAAIVRDFWPEIRVLENEANRGKGFSVRRGLLEARGKRVLFSDADLSTPLEFVDPLSEHLDEGADVAIGSRALPDSVIERHQVIWRESAGRFFNLLVRLVSGMPFHDTQCGFKAYKRSAAKRIAALQRLEDWAFDVEQLRIARLLDMRVDEVAVHWVNSPATRIKILVDGPKMLLDILKIRMMRYDLKEDDK
ncbi:MAG: dolichyl-phosphate beta-glucosyltransferase [Candidatus Sumerlaeota bacterium]